MTGVFWKWIGFDVSKIQFKLPDTLTSSTKIAAKSCQASQTHFPLYNTHTINMKSVAAVLALAASASAFAPAPVAKTSTSLDAVWDNYSGGVDFKGGEFKFDPLGLSETYAPLVPFFRESEIRHGRTAMLAVTGFIVADFVRIPGDAYSFAAVPKVVDAHDALLQGPMHQLLLWISLWDIVITYPSIQATMKGEREPGDFGWTMMAPKDSAAMEKKKLSELMNGRLAMMAVGGIATQSVMSGHGFPYL